MLPNRPTQPLHPCYAQPAEIPEPPSRQTEISMCVCEVPTTRARVQQTVETSNSRPAGLFSNKQSIIQSSCNSTDDAKKNKAKEKGDATTSNPLTPQQRNPRAIPFHPQRHRRLQGLTRWRWRWRCHDVGASGDWGGRCVERGEDGVFHFAGWGDMVFLRTWGGWCCI